jgi:hypothetical protein
MKSALIILVLSSTFVMTASPTLAQVMYGCVKTGTGLLRVVSAPSQCGPSETAVAWNVTGPQGPAGVANGITTAVHGTASCGLSGFTNVCHSSGDGFTVSGSFGGTHISFNTPFPGISTITCTLTPHFPQGTLNCTPSCILASVSSTGVSWTCLDTYVSGDLCHEQVPVDFTCVQ